MSTNKQGVAIVGVGAVACAACCAAPGLGFLAALSAGTILGVTLFGVFGLLVAAVGIAWLVRRRRRRATCRAAPAQVTLPLPTIRARS